jgi:hypothetical protein
MKQRRIRKRRNGVSRSGCRKIDRILVWAPIRRETPCWPEVQDE